MTRLKRAIRISLLPLAMLGALAMAPSAANAAGSAGGAASAASPGSVVKITSTVAEPSAAERASAGASASCTSVQVVRGGFVGYAKCFTTILDVQYSSGIWETFVVGTTANNNIYHIWQVAVNGAWTGWKTLPGNGTAVDGMFFTQGPDALIVQVLGTTGRYYCNSRSSNWSGWYLC